MIRLPEGTLWYAGGRKTLVSGSLETTLEPLATSFLVLDPSSRNDDTYFAYCEHGHIVQTGTLVGENQVTSKVKELYLASISNATPLIVVFEIPKRGFSFHKESVRSGTMQAIKRIRASRVSRQAPIPRVFTIPKPDVSAALFGAWNWQAGELFSAQKQMAEEVLGAALGNGAKVSRCVCLSHSLSRSVLGENVTPRSFVGRQDV